MRGWPYLSTDGQVFRLHQQDLCQATGLPPYTKYESEGGPSLPTVFDLVREEVADPLTAARTVLDWVIFNVLVHNADAHAKNVSILRTMEGRHALAPFYDLVCTGAGKSLVVRTVAEIANRIPAVLDEEMMTLEDRLGRIPRRQQVEGTIKDRVRRSLELLG